MANEKRKSTRVHGVHLVQYTKMSEESVPELMGMGNTIDLSEGGLRLTVQEPLQKGDTVHLDFTVEGKLIRTDAKVAHVQEVKHYKVGFTFGEGLDADEAAKIKEYLAKHAFKDRSQDSIQ
jgi:hypothetical protein